MKVWIGVARSVVSRGKGIRKNIVSAPSHIAAKKGNLWSKIEGRLKSFRWKCMSVYSKLFLLKGHGTIMTWKLLELDDRYITDWQQGCSKAVGLRQVDTPLTFSFYISLNQKTIRVPLAKGTPVNHVDKRGGGRGSPKCQRYYISLFSKLVNEGEGVKKPRKSVNVVYESIVDEI